jgi:5'-methylthioadenosine phosphorylase
MVTDYDCWREGGEAVEVSHILEIMAANSGKARGLVRRLVEALPAEREPSPIDTALDGAIITAPGSRDPAMVERLSAVAGRVLNSDVA